MGKKATTETGVLPLAQMVRCFQLMAQRTDVLQDTHGNLSMKVDNTVLIKPSGVPYAEITEEDVCVLDVRDGVANQIGGVRKPSVDTTHHLRIYENNPWLNAICHTHSPHVVAHAIVESSINCLSTEQADVFGGDIDCRPYEDLDSWGNNLVLRGQRAILLGRHGALTFSDKGPETAVELAVALENVARKNILARIVHSGGLSSLRQTEVQRWHERYQNGYGQK